MRSFSKGIRQVRSIDARRCLLGLLLPCLAVAIWAPPAQATFHLVSISEVYPGSAAHPDSSFLELEAYEKGQNFVGGHTIELFDGSGTPIGTFTFPSDLPGEGKNQQTMLVGDDGVAAAFGVTPDLIDPGFNIPAAGGAACWTGLDCVSWGDFSGSTTPGAGVPAAQGGIPNGMSLNRRISGGSCGNLLDEADDTNDSDSDFFEATPTPQSYATIPTPPDCVVPPPSPGVVLDSKPAGSTNSAAATFDFHAGGAGGFECRLDKGSYENCDAGTITYPGPLSEGGHSFRVRATGINGVGLPTTYSWVVDLTAPTASLTAKPANPSPGKSVSFRYASSEGNSKFECRLSPVEASFAACNTQPKTYSNLADGDYEFIVRAVDAAGNVQALPTTYPWTVDNSLIDTTPPETSITSKPGDPSSSPVASFTYASSESGSRFECKLDDGPFSGCPTAGISYSGLGEGGHTFQVRAIDASNNVDQSPAGYSFSVVLSPALTGSAGPSSIPTRTSGATETARPNTTIAKTAVKLHDRTPTFRFRSSKSGATFQCKLDKGAFVHCRSPYTTETLAFGSHTLTVRAVVGGVADPSPAKVNFKIVKKG